MIQNVFLNMKRLFIFLFLMPCTFSCANKKQLDVFRLRISIDSNANFYVDNVGLNPSYILPTDEYRAFHSDSNGYYSFDSLKSGIQTVVVRSLFNRTYLRTIFLTSDSILKIRKEDLHNYENDDNGILFNKPISLSDTIRLTMISTGCFHRYVEKTQILNTGMGYQIRHLSNRNSASQALLEGNFGKEFSAVLDTLQKQWSQRKEGFAGASTTSDRFYINIGNKVFMTPYCGGKERYWSVYYNFTQHFDSTAKLALAENIAYEKRLTK